MSQRIYLCDRVKRVNMSNVKSINGEVVSYYNQTKPLTALEDISKATFTEESQQSDPGLLAIQKLELYGNIELDLFTEMIEQPQLFELTFSDGTTRLWGDKNRPVMAGNQKREKNATQVTFQRYNPGFEF